jgi:hypothetical protein
MDRKEPNLKKETDWMETSLSPPVRQTNSTAESISPIHTFSLRAIKQYHPSVFRSGGEAINLTINTGEQDA